MILGSDYPVPVCDMPPTVMKGLSLEAYVELLSIRNPIEKNFRQLLAMGFPPDIGTRAAEVLPARAFGRAAARPG
jgi:hypothetical protein